MSLFDKFADAVSKFVSRAGFFAFCVLLVIVWAPSLPVFGSIDTWQLVINTATTIITFLMVALLQNSQWRGDHATNEKLNAIADGLADTMHSLAELMRRVDLADHERQLLEQADELRRTVGLEREISTSGDGDRSEYEPEEERRSGASPPLPSAGRR